MINYLNEEVDLDDEYDPDDLMLEWKKFPRFVCKVIFANSYLYTSLMDIS